MGLSYDEQLARKQGRVAEALARHRELADVVAEPCLAAEPVAAYRTRAKLMVARGPRIGLYGRAGAHIVVDIPGCVVLAPPLREVAKALRALLKDPPAGTGEMLVPFDSTTDEGALTAVDLREVREGDADASVLVTLVLGNHAILDHAALVAAAKAIRASCPNVVGVAANFRAKGSPQVLGPETRVLDGADLVRDRMGRAWQLVSFGSFVQAHRGQAARIHDHLAHAIAGESGSLRGKRVLDLYGGSGAIGLSLASEGAHLELVESFAPAAEGARRAAREQGLHDVRVLSMDAADGAALLLSEGKRFDAVVANPPRRGLAPEVRTNIARLAPPVIAYVSCDPDTLARDLGHFARLGYATATVQPFDMIPLTGEVESVGVLHRGKPLAPTVLYEDDDILVIDKPPHEPTTPQGEHAISLLERVRQLLSVPDATPVHRLDIGTSGLLLIARSPDRVAAFQRALVAETGRKIYLAAVKGITPVKGTIARPLRDAGRMLPSRTRYRRLAILSGHSLLRVLPEEGRTHQIRRHLKGIGHPVLGDERYGHAPSNRHFIEKYALDRSFLHCVRLEIDHPRKGSRLVVESPLPGDLRGVLERTCGISEIERLEQRKSLG